MKIYDIITEATPGTAPQYTPGAAARRAAMNAPSAITTSAPKNLANVAGRSGLTKTGGMWNKFDRYKKAIDLNKARTAAQANQAVAKWTSRLGPWFWLFRILGVVAVTEELIRNIYGAEDLYARGEMDDADLKNYRQMLWGQYVATFLIPALLSRLKIATIVSWVARWIVTMATGTAGAIAGVGTAGAAAAGAVAAVIAEQVFFTALQLWLQSPSTAKWLAEHCFHELVMLGTIPENLWDLIANAVTGTDAYQYAKEKRKTTPPSEKTKTDTDTPAADNKLSRYSNATGTIMPSNTGNTSLQSQELY